MRYKVLDSIRGLTIYSMIIYHAIWDVVYIWGRDIAWYRSDIAYVWQQSICWTFILLSGFCWPLGRHKIKRGLTTIGAGSVVSFITILFMPEERIVFGILTMMGSCTIIMIPFEKLFNKISPLPGILVSTVAFVLLRNVNRGYIGFEKWNLIKLPDGLYNGNLMTYLGFTDKYFFSTDYFSIFPWIFLFITGYFVFRLVKEKHGQVLMIQTELRGVSFVGKHSLMVYMLHQPVLYAALLMLENIG